MFIRFVKGGRKAMQANRDGFFYTPVMVHGRVDYVMCVQTGKAYDIYRSGKLKAGCYTWRSFQGVFYDYIELVERYK